ncbi:Separin [Exophiala dermatitidis]
MIAANDCSPPSKVDNIRAGLNLPAPTPHTLRYLRAILGLDDSKPHNNIHATTKDVPNKPVRARNPSRTAGKPCRNGVSRVPVHESCDGQTPRLSPADRRQIATEVFNTTLKHLGQAAKGGQTASTSKTTGTTPLRRPTVQRALDELSPNKENKKDVVSPKKGSKQCAAPDLSVIADVSHVALKYLRECGDKEHTKAGTNDKSLDNASLILLDRTITLHLVAQAQCQLCEIHLSYMRAKTTQAHSVTEDASVARCLLGRPDAVDDTSAFGFTTSMQSQGLRLAILLGPKAITRQLLHALQPETVGSPAWMTIQGLQKKLHNAEQAGKQLRTISLALSKLYSIGQKSDGHQVAPTDLFELFCLALRLKFKSWKHLHHSPDPEVDVWRHFHAALKRLLATSTPSAPLMSVVQHLRVFQQLLRAGGANPGIPLGVIEAVITHTQGSTPHTEILLLAEEHMQGASGTMSLILCCYLTTSRLKMLPQDLDVTVDSIERTIIKFREESHMSPPDFQKLLVYSAHLRKATLEAMAVGKNVENDHNALPTAKSLQLSAARLIYVSSRLLLDNMQVSFAHARAGSGEAPSLGFLTTVVKTIEAVLTAEKWPVSQAPEIEATARDALISCSTMIQLLRGKYSSLVSNKTIKTAVVQLNVRMSNAFWVRLLQMVQERWELVEQRAMLQLSLRGLTDLPMAEQKAAYFSLKCEKLAVCYQELGDHQAAKSMLQNAIDFHIKDGILNDVVESLLSGHFRSAWSRHDLHGRSLAANLVLRVRWSLENPSAAGDSDILYDDPSLPPLHRAVLLEKQICAMGESSLNEHQLSHWQTRLQFILSLLDEPQYRVYRLRFANMMVQLALRKRMACSAFLIDAEQANSLLASRKSGDKKPFLHEFESGLVAIFTLQFAFLTGQTTNGPLEEKIKRLSEIIQPCKTIEDADKVFADIENTVFPLRLSIDWAMTFGHPAVALVASETLYHVIELTNHPPEAKLSVLLQLCKIHNALQDVRSAATTIARADKLLDTVESRALLEVELALSHVEHCLSVETYEECLNWLDRARDAWDAQKGTGESSSSKSRLKEQTLLCTAAHLASRLAFLQGRLSEATVCGRQAAKIAGVIWLSIEKACKADSSSMQSSADDQHVSGITLDLSRLTLSHHSAQPLKGSAVAYWPQIALYCSVLSNLATLNAHCGLYQAATWFYEEGLKVARKAGQHDLEAGVISNRALLHARAGQLDKARQDLDDLALIPNDKLRPPNQTLVLINRGDVQLLLGDFCSAEHCVKQARLLLKPDLTPTKCTPVVSGAGMKASRTVAKTPARKTTARSRTQTAQAAAKATAAKACLPTPTVELRALAEGLSALESGLQLCTNRRNGSAEMEPDCVADADPQNPRKSVADALALVQTALKLFSEDADNNVLAETAMALPVRYRSSRKSGRVSFVQDPALLVRAGKLPELGEKKGQKRANESRGREGKALISEAYQILSGLRDCPQSRISSDIIHTTHKILAQISLLSTALGHPFVTSSKELVFDKCLPLDLARKRERLITLSEQATTDPGNVQCWPSVGVDQVSQDSEDLDIDLDIELDSLPASWSIVSLGLSDDRSELLVARLNAGRSPFIVRIPLTRPEASETETEDLDFDKAKAELQDIIAQANSSSHDPRGCSADKSLRKAWYNERKALDQQLATLLDNMENVWFGGFRGLLSAPEIDDNALLRFGQSFSKMLNRHLPSRRKASKSVDTKIELHSHVLELFVTLGHPREAELEDAIVDLLYFVIDILQFNGERNAYDEIDFDAMLVEVLDALHSYHEEHSRRAQENPNSHVILVLDKELQAFPWESMPCLRGRPVSRMPSLGAIWQRLKVIQDQSSQNDGYTIPSTEGTYILNPSSDLTSTQEMFGQAFMTQLSQFKAIVNRPPGESEFEEALHNRPLMLYFGHGGGAQYIRGCKIRRMDKCAVTLLMGCSSAKLTECGVYEPYGMPWNYLQAGSPAVVGNLWDVTDRDIDRFAMKLMNQWGLIQGTTEGGGSSAKTGATGKSGKTRSTEGEKMGAVSLDQAVAEARDECLLKYLNGAAPVMYGVPVFLK